jgi:hypothetical protein
MLTIQRKTAAVDRRAAAECTPAAGGAAAPGGAAGQSASTPGWERRIDLLLVRRLAA